MALRAGRPSGLIVELSQSASKALIPPTSDSEPLGDALAFMRLLWAVAHGLESSSKRMHAQLGVTGPQRLVLRIVGHYRRIAAGQLAEILHIHPSSLTGMLKRLEEAELLRRESDPFDRRRALLALTKRGQRLNDQRQGTIEAAVAGALTKMSKERVASAKTVLKAIAAALTAEDDARRR
jgi:MarR family transcriptional regulator, organic hydroperoxide resistance regulator